jgi:hypothetical protein
MLSAVVFGRTPDNLANLVVMETADAPGVTDRHKLTQSLKLASGELKVEEGDLPAIMVFHLSRAEAAKLHLSVSSAGINHTDSSAHYEMWVIDEPSDCVYSGMAEKILEHHFEPKVSDSERARIVQSVCSRLGMIVGAERLQKKGSSDSISPSPIFPREHDRPPPPKP